jgi:hypothetical protein
VPPADVLRYIIDDAGPNREVTIHIDDRELSLAEFGRLIRVHASSAAKRINSMPLTSHWPNGWAMRSFPCSILLVAMRPQVFGS